jgi:hypothetical protein
MNLGPLVNNYSTTMRADLKLQQCALFSPPSGSQVPRQMPDLLAQGAQVCSSAHLVQQASAKSATRLLSRSLEQYLMLSAPVHPSH